jgi:acetyl-CoA synthetase
MHLAGSTYDEVISTFRWEVPVTFNIAEAICDRHALATPGAPALIIEDAVRDQTGKAQAIVTTTSFGQLQRRANRLANALRESGVGRGDVVAIHLPQCLECPMAHIATQKLGAISLPMFNLFGPDAIRFRLIDSAAKVLITSQAGHDRIASGLGGIATLQRVLVVGGDDWLAIERASDQFTNVATTSEDPALLMYTSGTTGNPKGVLHAARVLLGHLPGVVVPHAAGPAANKHAADPAANKHAADPAANKHAADPAANKQVMFPQAGDRFWTPADWAWAGGLLDVLWPSLYFGVPVVGSTRGKFDAEWAFKFMAVNTIRNVFMPPTALRLLRQLPPSTSRAVPKLRTLGTGGETLGADMIAWGHDTFGLTIHEFYGQTECNLVIGNCSSLFPVRAGSMGRAIPGHTVAVVDDQGSVLPAGTPGIVAVKRPDPVLFLGYWNRPDATAEKFRGDWFLLGDVATKDADGYFWYQGRDDDLIKSNGYRIGPDEIELSLLQHHGVQAAGVIGVPDPLRGERVVAFVVPAAGLTGSTALAAELQAYVKARLAAHEYPREIIFVDALPTTITGKLRRIELRQRYADFHNAKP